ncbi:MAG TPA: tRNA dihydrouridine synthase DusB [Polyangia bacterium]|nr:tRNA dihydrouridine synthase DusB [Polyangia bacterium]
MTACRPDADLRIGPFEIAPGACLAPMAGITNPPFRRLCRELGAVLTVTELISCHAVIHLFAKERNRRGRQGTKTLALLERHPGERPLAIQLYGRDPEQMAEAARIVAGMGAEIVDLNFGCPARKVVKDGRGCGVALMRDPALVGRIAGAVLAAVGVPVTAKIRAGWSAAEQNAVAVARVLAEAGISALCVHGRTREQGHAGPVDLDAIAAVVDAVAVPVIGNGGIRGRDDAEEMIRRTGCARVAVGQASKGNPWIFSEIGGGPGAPGLEERVAICRRHLGFYLEWCGEERAVLEMRKHACWYLKGFAGAAAVRRRMGEAVDAAAFHRLLDGIVPG